jgi:bromodomain and PHD finger-containing protein 3
LQRLLSDNGINRLSLVAPDTPTGAAFSGVGRRTSVLFKKAKNGVKLQRSPDRALENGEDNGVMSSPTSPASIEDERHSRKRPRSRSCSDSEGEQSPQQEEETGDPACDFSCYLSSAFLLCLASQHLPQLAVFLMASVDPVVSLRVS